MNYKEQLSTAEWLAKRKSILHRDKMKCTNCYNKVIISSSEIGGIFATDYNSANNYLTIFIETPTGQNDKFAIRFGKFPFTAKGCLATFKDIGDNLVLTGIINKKVPIENFPFSSVDMENLRFFKPEIIKPPKQYNLNNIEWLYVSNLHVHHKYYQQNRLAWQYPDEALTSLCWKCHEMLHKNVQIEILDTNGALICKKDPCLRCHGAGWFPEYNHVENGICFRCNGMKFED